MKPILTERNKIHRVARCLNFFNGRTLKLNSMYDFVHLDQKVVSLLGSLDDLLFGRWRKAPQRSCKSKRFIRILLFLFTIARPRFDSDGDCILVGKLGMWPFHHVVNAHSSSRNSSSGSAKLKVLSVNKEVYKEYLIQKVIPSIISKWPGDDLGRWSAVMKKLYELAV